MPRAKKAIDDWEEIPEETKIQKGEVRNPKGRPPKVVKNARDKITRAKAIKMFCAECMGYQVSLIKDCPDIRCPLWTFRKGTFEHSDVSVRTKSG